MIDVAFAPNDVAARDVAGRAVVVIDVLRATTTICAALASGVREVIPVTDTDEALRLRRSLGPANVILAGERRLEPIAGFQAGNSPREMTPDRVGGKALILCTTNGTGALLATAGARDVIVAAGVNLSAAGARARELYQATGSLLILCAGRETGFGLDDTYIAGRLVRAALGGRRTRKGLGDSAIAAMDLVRCYGDRLDRVLALSAAGRDLVAHSLGEDVRFAAQLDMVDFVPVFHERRVTLAPPSPAA
jgi:2-phosphosulfolactate phosphatase